MDLTLPQGRARSASPPGTRIARAASTPCSGRGSRRPTVTAAEVPGPETSWPHESARSVPAARADAEGRVQPGLQAGSRSRGATTRRAAPGRVHGDVGCRGPERRAARGGAVGGGACRDASSPEPRVAHVGRHECHAATPESESTKVMRARVRAVPGFARQPPVMPTNLRATSRRGEREQRAPRGVADRLPRIQTRAPRHEAAARRDCRAGGATPSAGRWAGRAPIEERSTSAPHGPSRLRTASKRRAWVSRRSERLGRGRLGFRARAALLASNPSTFATAVSPQDVAAHAGQG